MEQPVSQPAVLHHSARRQYRLYNVLMVVIMGLGSIAYGYASSILATTLAQPTFIAHFNLHGRHNANQLIGLMNSLYQAGGVIGVLTVPLFADRWGRRAGIAVSALVILIAGAFLAGSVDIGMFIFFRFVSGAGAFMILAAVPLWMNEVTPPIGRGIFVNIHGAALLLGFTIANWIGYGFYHFHPEDHAQWRAPLALQCLPVFLLILCLPWMPESPRWLLTKGRAEEAEKVFQLLHTREEAAVELMQVQHQLEIDQHLESSYWSILTKPSYRKRMFIGVFVTASLQFCGSLVINNYGPIIYGALGFNTEKQFIYQGGWITTAFAGGLLSLLVIDLIPRPKLLGGGILGCLGCLSIEAALVSIYATSRASLENPNSTALRAAVAVLFVFEAIFATTLDGTQFVYVGEIFPTHLRAKGMSIACAGIAVMNIMWLQVAPTAFATIGWKFYLCFIIPGTVWALIIWFCFPDTKGMPLEEVAAIFGDKVELYAGQIEAETFEAKGVKV